MDLQSEMQIDARCYGLESELHCQSAMTVHVCLHTKLMEVDGQFTHLGLVMEHILIFDFRS